jgi:hypothetical protein
LTAQLQVHPSATWWITDGLIKYLFPPLSHVEKPYQIRKEVLKRGKNTRELETKRCLKNWDIKEEDCSCLQGVEKLYTLLLQEREVAEKGVEKERLYQTI